jgi:hypothetical protein
VFALSKMSEAGRSLLAICRSRPSRYMLNIMGLADPPAHQEVWSSSFC